ncbi:J domain-containing protein [Pseudanabaena sp. 'Roaring Creek']|uniref:J domain-containing protein n=1 Tax=Pseudanabaena sp. 'Roaring Creek' TaxID=1681830 RepID=UPI0006D7DED9|nr:J domain-containing protein [Pseudanabaena sp. 'Roaring Creek']
MARKSKTLTDTNNNELGLSDLRVRLNFLEKENSKLIKQIETNRTKLNALNDSIKEVGIQIAQRVAPFRQKILELDEQIHAVFQEILTGRKLGKKSRKDIETVYYNLQLDGVISPKHLPIEEELFKNDDDFEDEFDWSHYRGHSNQQIIEDIPKPDRDELKKIRQLFLRLADSFHPDKVTDEAEKEYRTEIMKEINLAYQDGDLARLLAIEKEQELGAIIDRDSTDDLSRHCAKVEAENRYLKDQLENLKQQLKITKKTQQGEMTATFKKITKYGGDPIGEALREIEDQIAIIEQMHQFVVDFRDRRMTIKEFLKGPTSMQLQQMSEEELMLEFLAQFQ